MSLPPTTPNTVTEPVAQQFPAITWQRPSGVARCYQGRSLLLIGVALGLVCLATVIGLLSVPRMFSAWANRKEYRSQTAQRELLGRRLNLQVEALSALQPRIAEGLESASRLRQAVGLQSKGFAVASLGATGAATDAAIGAGRAEQPVTTGLDDSSIYFDLASTRLQIERTARLSLNQWGAELQVLEESLVRDENEIGLAPTILPIVGEQMALSADFGRQVDRLTETTEFHAGLLFAIAKGTRVVAPAAGRVVYTGLFRSSRSYWQRYGKMVVLRHGERYISILGHCDRIRVSRGQRVERGDWVADSGESGLPPHPGVYYEIRRRDMDRPASEGWIPLDPKFFILNYRWPGEESWRSGGVAQVASEYDGLPYALRK